MGKHRLDAAAAPPIRLVFKKDRRDISFCMRLLSRILASIRIQKKEYLTQVTSGTTNGYHALPQVLPDIYMAADTLGMQSDEIIFVSFFLGQHLSCFKTRKTLIAMAFPTMGIDTHGSEFKVVMTPDTRDPVTVKMCFMRKFDGSRIYPYGIHMRKTKFKYIREAVVTRGIYVEKKENHQLN